MGRLVAFFLLPFALQATELAPWYGRSLEFEARASALYQNFRSIATPIKPTNYPSFGQFYTFSLGSSFDRIGVELELGLAKTPARSFGFDNFRVTSRYIWLDDVIGDTISLVFGTTSTWASKKALRDISSFHHGLFEIEGHMAFGREVSCESFWFSRWWGVFGFGTAIEGRPWARVDFRIERNFWDTHSIRAFIHTLWGIGDYDINLKKEFVGYGLVKHRSVDLGVGYATLIGCSGGEFSFEIAQRVYALNFPKNATILYLRLLYPFGL